MLPYKAKIVYFPKYLDISERRLILEKNQNDANLVDEEYIWTDLSRIDLNGLSDNQYACLFLGDEAYAGSKSFIKLNQSVQEIFNKEFLIPAHNIKGAWNLVIKVLEKFQEYELEIIHYDQTENQHLTRLLSYYGINTLESKKQAKKISIFLLNSLKSCSLDFESVKKLLSRIKGDSILTIADFSNVFSFTNSDLEKVKTLSDLVDVIVIDCSFDLMCNTGALIITNDFRYYENLTEWVVAFEGLHTYGGLSGREMEVINQGLNEAKNNYIWQYKKKSLKFLYEEIKKIADRNSQIEISPSYSTHYFYIKTDIEDLNNLLFLIGQARGYKNGKYIYLYLPSRKYQKQNLELFIHSLELSLQEKNSRYILRYLDPRLYTSYNFKSVEIINLPSLEERREILEKAGYNTFLIPSDKVYIDFLTDSGTSSLSDEQWSSAILHDQKRAYSILKEAIEDVFGFSYFLPTHQGRAAEHILSQTMIKPGQFVINNMYFTTTRFHQEYAKGIFVDLIIEEAYKPEVYHPFKGNIDTEKLVDFIEKNGPQNIAYVCIENNVNMAGGQPVSLENIKQIRKICDYYNIPIVLDATRIAENAFFIKEREQGYSNKEIKEIIREIMSLVDAATISAKKDPLTNISGLILIRSPELYTKMKRMLEIFEGEYFNGGLPQRDIAMLAQGIREMTDYYYLKNRIDQVRYLGNLLKEAGIPIVEPIGGHAIYLDAKRFLPHIKQDEFPAQTLAAYIYLYGGVRTMERGIVSAGRDPKTGKHKYPELELVRITIPRRVYTNEHMEYTRDVVKEVYDIRDSINGLSIVYEPPFLRFFTMRFEPIKKTANL
ncbi:MAG: tryptophanase [Candidatus Calescibacterium sp.]|nr:tryptophanase [Candidatus Calescibacterium sp.]MCX7971723.1 tryptophanase [bacterium]MDW8195329.1 tryptophanase [Candidatus Calescibacterium sp.]